MASNDPSYVRLASRLSRGLIADVHRSGWSIAGLDVRKFPEDPQAAKFVRKALNDGKLEPASKGEWEDAHDDGGFAETVIEQNPDFGNSPQEAKIRIAARAAQEKLKESRQPDLDPEEEYDRNVRQPRQQRARTTSVEAVDEESLDEMSKGELQEVARQYGLATSGNMDDLRERIVEHLAEQEEDEDDE